MKKIDIGQTIQILANVGVIAGIIFLAMEIRTNTATNRIAVFQGSSANWMQINAQLATDEELVVLLDRAFAGERLDGIESRQFEGWVKQQLTHAAFVRRLFDAGILSEADFRLDFSEIRTLAESPMFRRVIDNLEVTGRFRELILANDEEFNRLVSEER